MIKALFIIALALLPETVFSQTAKTTEPPPERITKIVRVHYENPEKIGNLLANGASVMVNADNMLGVIVLKGTSANIAKAEQAIKELDVPPAFSTANDIELTVYLIGASNNTAPISNKHSSAIEPVIKQLGAIFPYKSYELLSTMLLRSQQGRAARSSGIMNYNFDSEAPRHPGTYGISYRSASVSSDKSKAVIHLENFKFDAKVGITTSAVPNSTQYQNFDIGTQSDVDIREGQKVVVGKTDVANDGSAIFIVLTAKLVD